MITWWSASDRGFCVRRSPTSSAGEPSGPYSVSKTAGPARLSLADRGVTFATNRDAGLCIRFAEPVPAIDPFRRILHPGITVTVEQVDDLQRRRRFAIRPTAPKSRAWRRG